MGFIQLVRTRMRGLKEGTVQRVRVEASDIDGKDDVERFQDYGFAANPVYGQGLSLHIGGHTITLRMDRLAERPQLAPYEVSVWHKEGHHVTLRNGKVVEVECATLRVNATTEVEFLTPKVKHNGVEIGEKHAHGSVLHGGDNSGPPIK